MAADNMKPIYQGEMVQVVTVNSLYVDGREYTVSEAEALRDSESGELRNEIDAALKAIRAYQRAADRT